MSEIYEEYEDQEAYAKIQGPGVKNFITKLNIIIGRDPGESTEECQAIPIYSSAKVSRKHLRIFWEKTENVWKIENLSKNKVFVNKTLIKKGDTPSILEKCSAIQFDKVLLYFFPAINDQN